MAGEPLGDIGCCYSEFEGYAVGKDKMKRCVPESPEGTRRIVSAGFSTARCGDEMFTVGAGETPGSKVIEKYLEDIARQSVPFYVREDLEEHYKTFRSLCVDLHQFSRLHVVPTGFSWILH